MPLLFSYGTLQLEDVQLSTLGRRLEGWRDELRGFELSQIEIEDPEVMASTGMTHYANVVPSGDEDSRVAGIVFEVTDAELERIDEYEGPSLYRRIQLVLSSGRQAWVYTSAR